MLAIYAEKNETKLQNPYLCGCEVVIRKMGYIWSLFVQEQTFQYNSFKITFLDVFSLMFLCLILQNFGVHFYITYA